MHVGLHCCEWPKYALVNRDLMFDAHIFKNGITNKLIVSCMFTANSEYMSLMLLHQHRVSQEEVIRQCKEQKFKDLIYELASAAHNHLNKVRAFFK